MDLEGITLRIWADKAQPGEQRIYHLGFLARAEEASTLAAVALELQHAGEVNLVQKRIAEDMYVYIAQRRSRAASADAP